MPRFPNIPDDSLTLLMELTRNWRRLLRPFICPTSSASSSQLGFSAGTVHNKHLYGLTRIMLEFRWNDIATTFNCNFSADLLQQRFQNDALQLFDFKLLPRHSRPRWRISYVYQLRSPATTFVSGLLLRPLSRSPTSIKFEGRSSIKKIFSSTVPNMKFVRERGEEKGPNWKWSD